MKARNKEELLLLAKAQLNAIRIEDIDEVEVAIDDDFNELRITVRESDSEDEIATFNENYEKACQKVKHVSE